MPKIAHIADLHIGSNQYGIAERKEHYNRSIIKLAHEIKDHDICLIAGDIFDSPSPSPDDLSLWIDFCEIISHNHCSIVACVGNHDKLHNSSIQWVDLSTSISPRKKHQEGEININRVQIEGINITYLDHIKRRDILKSIQELEETDILMMHQSASGFLNSIMRPELDEEALKLLSSKCKYLALGDLHVHKIMKLSKDCTIAYPGNIDFLRLCDPYENLKYLCIDFGSKINSIESVEFEPSQKTQVIKFNPDVNLSKKFVKTPNGFFIIRHNPEDYTLVCEQLESLKDEFPDVLTYLYREKPKSKEASEEEEEEEVQEDTDFMSLIKKEKFLEDRDVDLISDIWTNSNAEHVESILQKDLEEQINANKQSNS